MSSNSNIRFRGGRINRIKGNLTVIDQSFHETNVESFNMYDNTITESYNTNFEKNGAPDGQRREDHTRPPLFQSLPHQNSSATRSSRIDNRDSFNIRNNHFDNAYNDYSETHYYGRVPPADQRDRPQNQTRPMGDGVLPQSVQFIDQRMRQTFGNRSLSDGNVPPNMPRNNYEDDEEFDESNDSNRPPPPISTSSEPIIRTFEGNYTKHDNSVHKTNISSHNAERNKVENCFNYNYSSRQRNEETSQRVVSARRQNQEDSEEE